MDAINAIVVNNGAVTVNAETVLNNQTIGSADFMTAFVNALTQGQTTVNQNGQTVDFAQLLQAGALNGKDADLMTMLGENQGDELLMMLENSNDLNQMNVEDIILTMTGRNQEIQQKTDETALLSQNPVKNLSADNQSTRIMPVAAVNEGLYANNTQEMNVHKTGANDSNMIETAKVLENVEVTQPDVAENNGLSVEIAKNLIMTGNAKDFSAGYLSLISQSENAVDLQSILSSVETLNGSVSQSLGLINAMENLGISQFVGLGEDGETKGTLSAEQLVMLSTLAKDTPSHNGTGSTLVDLLLDENFGGMGNLDSLGVTALLGGFGDYSADNLVSMISGTGGINSVLSAMNSDNDDNYSSLLGMEGFSSTNLLSSVFGTDNKDNETAIPLSSVIPLDALKQLANVKQNENISKLEKLAEAFEKGEATVSKTTQFVMTDNGVNKVNVANQQESVNNAFQTTQEVLTSNDNSQKDFSESDKLIYESNFNNAVREAKKNVNRETKTNESQMMPTYGDVQTQTVQSQERIAQITRAVRDNVTASNVRQQTVEQITAKLTQKYEPVETFSVKLTPEGLGDVVVNLEKTADGIVLELVASEKSTAVMLNKEMSELQSALNQFNAQVNEIRVMEPAQTQNQTNDGFLQQDFSEQFEQNQGTYRQGTPRYTRARNTISEQSVENTEAVYRDNSKINTYI